MHDLNNVAKLLRAARFAAEKHRGQKRKGADTAPYINHPLQVAAILSEIGGIADLDILTAALLHDVPEDTDTPPSEIEALFGARVRSIVAELTDDMSLPKGERKQRQVEHAPHMSDAAKQIKICDKISNISEVLDNPPVDWSDEERREYVEWGVRVFEGLRGVNARLDAAFEELAERARKIT